MPTLDPVRPPLLDVKHYVDDWILLGSGVYTGMLVYTNKLNTEGACEVKRSTVLLSETKTAEDICNVGG